MATPASATLAAVGPISTINDYPEYFEDASGLRLRLCDDPADGCTMAEVPNPEAPVTFPSNYPGESFYFATAANVATGSYEAALEAAFSGEEAAEGQNILFARIRIRLTGLAANTPYVITHPYGVLTLRSDATGGINYTDDQGCMGPCTTPEQYALAAQGFVGDSSATSMTFLTRTGFNPATATEGTPIGDPLNPTTVTGSPFGTNFVRVEGPNAGGPGVNVTQSSSFTIEGQVAAAADPNRPSTPDLVAASDTGRASTDNITSDTTPTFSGTATVGPVELLVNGQLAATGDVVGGAYSLTPATALTAGAHRVTVRASVPAADPTAPATTVSSGALNIQVDTGLPPAVVDTPRPTNGTIDSTPTFLFSSTEPGSTFECQLSTSTGAVVSDYEPCVSPLTYNELANGTYTFRVRATDVAGNVSNPAGAYTWAIGPVDTTAPTVTNRSPGSGATGVVPTANVTATFSEAVQDVSGTTFTLRSSTGAAVTGLVTYNATTRVATLDPGADLAASTTYTATLTGGPTAIRDGANNALASTSWSFTTAAANVAPTVTGRSPGANASGVAASTNVTATFSEAVTGVSGTTFTLRAPGSTTNIAATVTQGTSAAQWVLNPTADLAAGVTYTVALTGGTGAIRDLAGAPLASTSWTFTTTANAAPTVTTRAPAANATAQAVGTNVTATFSEAVTGVSGTTFTLRAAGSTTNIAAAVRQGTSAAQWILDPTANLANDTRYTVTLTGGATAIRDTAGAPLASTSWTFLTGPAPAISARTPGVSATNVNAAANVTATFSEALAAAPTGANIALRLGTTSTGTLVGAVVSYNATTRVVTLNPNANLTNDTRYSVWVSGLRDVAGNALPATNWTFLTGPAPTVTARTPGVNATNVGRAANVTATFSETLAAAPTTANVTLRLGTATTGTLITSAVSYNATSRVVTLNPGVTLAANTVYTVRLTGIQDVAGNPLPATTWSFTTGAA